MLVFYGLILHKSYGLQEYFKKFSYEGNPQAYVDQGYKYTYRESGRILVLGNSFGRDIINALNTLGVNDIKYYPITCDTGEVFKNNDALNTNIKHADVVIVAELWAAPDQNYKNQLASLNNCFSELKKLNSHSYIIGTKNFGYNNNFVKLLSEDKINDSLTVKPIHTYLEFDDLAKKMFGEQYISIINLIKNTDNEVPIFYQDKFVSYDTQHLTPAGARLIAKKVILESPIKGYLK